MKSDFRLAIRLEVRVLLLGLASTAALLGQQDANKIIRKAASAGAMKKVSIGEGSALERMRAATRVAAGGLERASGSI